MWRMFERVGLALVLMTGALAVGTVGAGADEPPPTLTIRSRDALSSVDPNLVGANYRYRRNGYDSWNSARNKPRKGVVAKVRKIGIETLRFPGGSLSNMYDWKRAIGPADERGCQIDARWGHNGSTGEFGIDEHMKLARLARAETMITVPFVSETPGDAADLVEYMNARVGQDPNNDGIDWARKRLRNQRRLGEPTRPYDIDLWSIGNEPYLKHQRYWLSPKRTVAMSQYLYGGTKSYTDQLVGRGCKLSPDVSEGTGRADQNFRVLYPPVMQNSQRVTVGGRVWREVADLSARTAEERVYTIDNNTGRIHFGNGRNGARPPLGADVRASYTGVHKGFLDFSRAMHRADPNIDVCSEWGQADFVRRARDERYDCLAAHSYTFLHYKWRNARHGFDGQMLGEARSARIIFALKRYLRRVTRGRTDLIYTEYGALSNQPQPAFRKWEASVADALYMVSALTRFVEADVPLAAGGTVTSPGNRSWLGQARRFRLYAPARFMQMVKPMIGGSVIRSQVSDVAIQRTSSGSSYETLRSLVTEINGKLNVLLINRDPNSRLKVRVRIPDGVYRSTASAAWMVSRDIADRSVKIRQRTVQLDRPEAFTVTVPAHSMLRLRLRPRG
jgi:alpha-N-arabinofuranosidase